MVLFMYFTENQLKYIFFQKIQV